MSFPGKNSVFFLALQWLVFSGNLQVQSCTFYVSNRCSFPIWPATAANQGHPVLANGGFHLPPGKTQRFVAPGDWTGRIWARTGCNFDSTTNHKLGCETGDCGGKLECNGLIGTPPATLVEFTLQIDKHKPNFYDVSLVDGYNLPVQVSTTSTNPSKKCLIPGCKQNLKDTCPEELKVRNDRGEVVACKSACLAFDWDAFCCRNEYGSPKTCKPSLYSRVFKEACPNYASYAFDTPTSLVSCGSDDYVITFCPRDWGSDYSSD
ncbi:hypothetical protein CASFOL_032999 [Castilleja foliolosa]|uniref:Thaumatin-like protein n=1 Tax=Castilleja foliolosa TaxID=1961234 RepID=A0ABD3C3Z0_9LAMI